MLKRIRSLPREFQGPKAGYYRGSFLRPRKRWSFPTYRATHPLSIHGLCWMSLRLKCQPVKAARDNLEILILAAMWQRGEDGSSVDRAFATLAERVQLREFA